MPRWENDQLLNVAREMLRFDPAGFEQIEKSVEVIYGIKVLEGDILPICEP